METQIANYRWGVVGGYDLSLPYLKGAALRHEATPWAVEHVSPELPLCAFVSRAKFGQYALITRAACSPNKSAGNAFSTTASHSGSHVVPPSSTFFSSSGVRGAAITTGWAGACTTALSALLHPARTNRPHTQTTHRTPAMSITLSAQGRAYRTTFHKPDASSTPMKCLVAQIFLGFLYPLSPILYTLLYAPLRRHLQPRQASRVRHQC
jgi:hypothetical protein